MFAFNRGRSLLELILTGNMSRNKHSSWKTRTVEGINGWESSEREKIRR